MARLLMMTLGALLVICFDSNARAADIAHCNASKGYGFYPKYGLAASNKEAGSWTKDQISNGQFSITLSDAGEFDVLFLDTSGGIYSSVAEGGKVVPLGSTPNSLSLLVSYPNVSAETFSVYRTIEGNAEMMWTQNKYGAPIAKVAAFIASCKFLSF